MLNKKTAVLILFLMSLLLQGCLDINMTLNVRPDGSGYITERVLFGEELTQMITGFGGQDTASESPFYDWEKLQEEARDMGDVTLTDVEEISSGLRQGYIATYTFEDVTSLEIKQDPTGKAPSMGGEPEDQPPAEKLEFRFSKNGVSELSVDIPKDMHKRFDMEQDTAATADTLKTQGALSMEILGMIREMEMSMDIRILGEIVETNATYREDSVVTILAIDFKKLLKRKEDVKTLEKLGSLPSGKAEGMIKNMDGMKLELNTPLNIKFR